MSTISEHTGHGHPPAASPQLADPHEQIDGMLEHFDVLPPRFDRFLFKYISVYLIGLFFLSALLNLLPLFLLQRQVGRVLEVSGLNALPIVIILFALWRFNVWRRRTPKLLRDFIGKKRIYVPVGDTNTSYLRFLEAYRDALASPKRYFFSGFLMILVVIGSAYDILQFLTFAHLNVVGFLAVIVLAFFWRGSSGLIMVRWCARIVGVVWGAFMAAFLIAESGGQWPAMTTIAEWVSFLAWAAVFVGIVLAFFWEGIGGLIIVLATLTIQGEVFVTAGDVFNPVIMIFAFVGLAFVYCWWRSRRLSMVTQSAT